MNEVNNQYNKLAETVLKDGFSYFDKSRDGIEMLQIPHYTLDIDITKGFPLITSKRIYWKTIFHELIWILSGSTNIDYLIENGIRIWTEDAKNFSGGTYVGRIYGAQWRQWTDPECCSLDQIEELINEVRGNLFTRRHLVTAWNPAELNNMALPPCHWSFEIIPEKNGFALKWHQRSCDVFLGIPFDIGLYGLLGKLLERELNIPFVRLIGDLSCVHFYKPHIPLIKEQLKRRKILGACQLEINPTANFNDLHITDLRVLNYNSHGPIKAKLYTKK